MLQVIILLTAMINKNAQNVMYQNQALGIHISHKLTSQLSYHKKVRLQNFISVTGIQRTGAITRNGYALTQHLSDANSGMVAIL